MQTIVSRENNPLDPVVVTVGTIHGGTKNSIIPDEVKLQLTVRTYKPQVRKRVLASIERVAKGEALAGGAPKEPLVKVTPAANAMYNDPALTKRLVATFRGALGQASVVEFEPTMVFEDFAEFNLAGIPSADFWVGAVKPENFGAAQQSGTPLPQLHSAAWAPDYTPTLKMVMTVWKPQNYWNCWDTNARFLPDNVLCGSYSNTRPPITSGASSSRHCYAIKYFWAVGINRRLRRSPFLRKPSPGNCATC